MEYKVYTTTEEANKKSVRGSTLKIVLNGLLLFSLAVLAIFAARDELTLKTPKLSISLLILGLSTIATYYLWSRLKEKRLFARECFLLILGGFVVFGFLSAFFDWIYNVHLVTSLWHNYPIFRLFAETFYYLFSILCVLLVIWLGYGRRGREAYFLRLEIHFADVILLLLSFGITAAVLSLWFRLSSSMNEWSPLGLTGTLFVALGIISALGNSIMEELIYRGFFLGTFMRLTTPALAILLQAFLFGFIHFKDGIPSGYSGWLLAGLFGAVLGYWTLARMSLLAPVILHFFVDAYIFFSVNRPTV